MSDFLRAFAATGAGNNSGFLYLDKDVRWHERLPRYIKSLPAYLVHSWRSSTCGFKICTFLSTTLLICLCLSLSAARGAFGQAHELAAPVVVKMNAPAKQALISPGSVSVPMMPSFYQGRRRAPCTSQNPCFIQVIADLDQKSKVSGHDQKPTYVSKLMTGRLIVDGNDKAEIEWIEKEPLDIIGRLAEEGRGMELSELVLYNSSMYAFDDRTGIVYELMASRPSSSTGDNLRKSSGVEEMPLALMLESVRNSTAADAKNLLASITVLPVAKHVLTEGDGLDSPKGMKIEWACEKNGILHVGSFGKEYTTPDGSEIVGLANFWVATLDGVSGKSERIDWTDNYNKLRESVKASFPGYLIHEAVNWSPFYRKWFFLPRRISSEPYNEQADEKRGSNKILITSPSFDEIHIVEVGFPETRPERGFSSFKFVPGTNDKLVIALRSAEDEEKGTQETYLSVFSVEGVMVTEKELLVSDSFKFEGIEVW